MTKRQHNGWAPNQVVAHNMTRARELRGMTQGEVAKRLGLLSGGKWSQATVAQAEGTVHGARMRNFTVNELYALARTFDLPILWFLTPPAPDEDVAATGASFPDQSHPDDWRRLLLYALGHRGNYGHLAAQLAPWHNEMKRTVTVPDDDLVHGENPEREILATSRRDREPTSAQDALVASLYGLASMALPGRPLGPDQILDIAGGLRSIGTVLEGLANYAPARTLHDQLPEWVSGETEETDDE